MLPHLRSGHWGIHAARLGTGQGLSATKQGLTGTQEDTSGRVSGAEGGIRTHTPLRAADFESAASTIPPLRRCVPCKKEEWSGRGDSNPRPSPWQGDALPLSHFRSDGGLSLHPHSTKKQAGCESLGVAGPPPHPTSSSPHPPTPSSPHPPTATPQPSPHKAVALATPAIRLWRLRRDGSTLPPCVTRPPPAPACRTQPAGPPKGAGIARKAVPPCPKNGPCRTGRIVSAADGFEADSFPKIENTWRWNESQEFPSS